MVTITLKSRKRCFLLRDREKYHTIFNDFVCLTFKKVKVRPKPLSLSLHFIIRVAFFLPVQNESLSPYK